MPPEDKDAELDEESYVKADHRASRDAEAAEPEEPTPEAGEPVTEPEEEAPEAPAPEPEGEPSEEAPPTETGEPLPDITVYSLLRMSVGMYAEQAWIHLGVRMDPNRNKVEQNLPYARVAIDTVDFLVQQLQPDLDEDDKKELDLLLANLRMNYVQRA